MSVERSTTSGQEVNYNSPTMFPLLQMFPLFQQSGTANRWWRSVLTVTQRQRPRFALSLPSAVRSNARTENRTLPPANKSLGKHHTQAHPRTKSGTDAVTFWQRFGFRTELSRGRSPGENSRLLRGSSVHNGQNASAAEACAMSCKRAASTACGFFTPSLSKGGEILAQWLPATLRIGQAIRAPIDKTITMDPRGTRYPSLKPRPSH